MTVSAGENKQELSLDIDICPRNAALKGNRYNLVPTTLLHCRFISGKNIIKILLTIKCHSMLLRTMNVTDVSLFCMQ
jgi:hypothetical protein